jgi:hypothetical protein
LTRGHLIYLFIFKIQKKNIFQKKKKEKSHPLGHQGATPMEEATPNGGTTPSGHTSLTFTPKSPRP